MGITNNILRNMLSTPEKISTQTLYRLKITLGLMLLFLIGIWIIILTQYSFKHVLQNKYWWYVKLVNGVWIIFWIFYQGFDFISWSHEVWIFGFLYGIFLNILVALGMLSDLWETRKLRSTLV